MAAQFFIEQFIDRNRNLLQTDPLPIEKLPKKVNQFRNSQFKTVAFWKITPRVSVVKAEYNEELKAIIVS